MVVVVFRARASGAAVQHYMPGDRDGRPDECNGAKDIESVQNQHRGQHNKPRRGLGRLAVGWKTETRKLVPFQD